jgi:hypothetical protein
MSKQNKKRLNIHPIHFHFGLYLALAALLVTTAKSSSELIKGIYAVPAAHYNAMHTEHMREAETLHGHANIVMARRTPVAGQ